VEDAWREAGHRSDASDAIIAKAMQTDREARYQTASEIRRDLDVILTVPMVQAGDTHSSSAIPKQALSAKPNPGAPIREEAASKPAAPLPAKKSNTGIYLGLGVAAALAVGAFVVFGSKEKPKPVSAADVPAAGSRSRNQSSNPLRQSQSRHPSLPWPPRLHLPLLKLCPFRGESCGSFAWH